MISVVTSPPAGYRPAWTACAPSSQSRWAAARNASPSRAASRVPPPMAMHIRPMRRVHQPDHGMIDVAGKCLAFDPARLRVRDTATRGGSMLRRVALVRPRHRPRSTRPARAPDKSARGFSTDRHVLAVHQRGDRAQTPSPAKAPAMIGTLDRVLGQIFPADSGTPRWGQISRRAKASPSLMRPSSTGSPSSISRRIVAGLQVARQRRHVPEIAQEARVGRISCARPRTGDRPRAFSARSPLWASTGFPAVMMNCRPCSSASL